MDVRNPKLIQRGAVALLLLAGWITLQGQALDMTRPPGHNFNLTNFYLGLPVDGSGGTTGNSASITAAQLTGGYSNALYFYTGPDGAMTFWAPVTGATTSGSSYPRSELREQINPPQNSSNWFPYGVHVLSAQCRVTQVPSTSKVIIGQIHCYTGNARPLVKLQYNNGVIEALIKTNSNFDPDYKFYFQNVGLGNPVNYQIRLENGLVTTTVNGSSQAINVFLTDPDWATNAFYFKAGSYCQDNVGPTNEGARVAFYALNRSHAPCITNQPMARSVTAGSSTTFTVNATGNGRLRYQWRFNETNNIFPATNAVFTLTNAQPEHAGGYSVRVTDNLGSVTSLTAVLTVELPPGITAEPADQLVISGSNALFSVAAGGSTPLHYQWYFNTNTAIPDATNATLILPGVTAGDAGAYSVQITNRAGAAQSRFANLAVNRPPVPGSLASVTGQEVPVADSVADLLETATDPDGDALSITSVGPLSIQGGSVQWAGPSVWYTPPPGFAGVDQWSYLLADNRGAVADGFVSVTVVASNAVALVPVGQSWSEGGEFNASYLGIPGLSYAVDRATNVSGPWELGFTNLVAGTNGVFELHDASPPQPQQFYRARYP